MANPQHSDIAKQGPYAIARWRESHWRGRVQLDLSGAHLSRVKLPGVDLANDELSGVDLTDADISRAVLYGSNLRLAHLSRASLIWSDLHRTKLNGASLIRTNLSGSCLLGADLQGADLSHADLSWADLRDANLTGANLTEANLAWADLSGVNLARARLTGTNLEVANLTNVDLRGASLVRAILHRTLMGRAVLELTLFADCDLGQTLQLESVTHLGPSIIGLDSLARSQGLIPDTFLRQAGVAESVISMQPSLRQSRSNYSRVLLVSSCQDEEFVERLEEDLRLAGFSCWRLVVDDEAPIRSNGVFPTLQRFSYYDQMVLVCSEASLASPFGWRFFDRVIQKPVAASIDIRTVIPLALDDQLYTREDPLCDDLRSRLVVDFRGWQSEVGYRSGLAASKAALVAPPSRDGNHAGQSELLLDST